MNDHKYLILESAQFSTELLLNTRAGNATKTLALRKQPKEPRINVSEDWRITTTTWKLLCSSEKKRKKCPKEKWVVDKVSVAFVGDIRWSWNPKVVGKENGMCFSSFLLVDSYIYYLNASCTLQINYFLLPSLWLDWIVCGGEIRAWICRKYVEEIQFD